MATPPCTGEAQADSTSGLFRQQRRRELHVAVDRGVQLRDWDLLVIGVRVVHGWSWLRSDASLVAAVALLAAIVGVFAMI